MIPDYDDFKLGNVQVSKIYLGDELIWEKRKPNTAVEYFKSLHGNEVTGLDSDGFAVACAVFVNDQLKKHPIAGVSLSAGDCKAFVGMYMDSNNDARIGVVWFPTIRISLAQTPEIPYIYGNDYDISIRPNWTGYDAIGKASQNGNAWMVSIEYYTTAYYNYPSGSLSVIDHLGNVTATTATGSHPYVVCNAWQNAGTPPPIKNAAFIAEYGWQGNSRPDLIGSSVGITLPSGTMGTDSYDAVIKAWVDANYPQYSYLF